MLSKAYRAISTRYPPVDLFERVAGHHMGSEYRATGAPKGDTAAARLYIGKIDGHLTDVRKRPAYHLPGDYRLGQALALRLRSAGHDGVLYQSVRHPGGLCVAAMRPPIVGNVKESVKLQFKFDGRCMTSFFNYSTDKRITIPPYLRPVKK